MSDKQCDHIMIIISYYDDTYDYDY